MAEVLLEQDGPNGNLYAVVESADDVCYLYLHGAANSNFKTRALWVRNHCAAPDNIDPARMRAGKAPLNPARFCRHPEGLPIPEAESLQLVWLPEGNGVALLEHDEILAIIPPWSGTKGFDGYSRDSVGQGPLAWEFELGNVLIQRIEDAQRYWRQWDEDDPWSGIQSSLLSTIESALGSHSHYYAIDGGEWPPKGLIRIARSEGTVLTTVGVSVRPQPNVELFTEEPEKYRRIELGVVLPQSWSETAIAKMGSYLSARTGFPWNTLTWLGPGHTVPCDSWQNADYPFALLQYDHPAMSRLAFDAQFGDPVNLLWLIPITETELQVATESGSTELVAQLPRARWSTA
jgi:hypothetical protein